MLQSSSFQFRPGWKLSLFFLFFFPITILLANWQLSREQWKLQLMEDYNKAQQAEPATLSEGAELYQRKLIKGRIDKKEILFLDNRTFNGQIGYELIIPVKLEQNSYEYAWVNIGWIAAKTSRSQLPDIPNLPTEVSWETTVRNQLTFDAQLDQHLPNRVQSNINLPKVFSEKQFPFLLQLPAENPYALNVHWQPYVMPPEKHRAYAVQWFLLGLALLVLYLYAGFIKRKHYEQP